MKMKYYLYCSESKLNMLYPQLSRFDRIKFQFSLNLKGFFVKLAFSNKKNKIQKMRQLSNYIMKKCDVGSIEDPKSYIKDTAKLKWGIIPMDAGDMVLFFLQKENLTLVLGGTPNHLITQSNLPKSEKQTRSDLFSIMFFFNSLNLEKNPTKMEIEIIRNQQIPEVIKHISSEERLVEQEVEFLAKIFLNEKDELNEKMQVIVGSPIYITAL